MHITKVELENIKSHRKSVFEFSRGTSSIIGQNGAGKSTIIEAIAWTLFDVLDYRKDDFLRRGSRKGHARVSFISGFDDREYIVYRDTGTGYYVSDPRLEMRVADKKEDVGKFLWRHLGVEPGTDLETLFKHAIGVPQGTLTAIFLATPAERKKTFDQLLKVEEYRRSAEELLKTQRYIENQRNEQDRAAAKLEGELESADRTRSDHERLKGDIIGLSEALAAAANRVEELTAQNERLEASEKARNAAKEVADNRRAELERADLLLEQIEKAYLEAKNAAERALALKPSIEEYETASGRLKELEREREVRDRLTAQVREIEKAEASIRSDEKHTRAKLEELAQAHSELDALRAAAEKQKETEAEIRSVTERLAVARAAVHQAEEIKEQLAKLRRQFVEQRDEVKRYKALPVATVSVEELEKREASLVTDLAKFKAELDRDERLRSELKNGMCPILSERCLNLKEGQTLETFLSGRFDELGQKIAECETGLSRIRSDVRFAKDSDRNRERLALLEERFQETQQRGTELKQEYDRLKSAADALRSAEAELETAEKRLAALNNPKGRLENIERQLQAEPEVRQRITEIESNLERHENDRKILDEQLADFVNLDRDLLKTSESKERLASAYREFVAIESLASRLPLAEEELIQAKRDAATAQESYNSAIKELEAAEKDYDPDRHQSLNVELTKARDEHTELRVRLGSEQKRFAELEREIDRLVSLRDQLDNVRAEAAKQQELLAATVFIRDTLKEAAPLVARNYVYHVSSEANQMFREITGNGERTLRWSEDYGIFVEEDGYERPFQSLSGGEQTSAAMAVRLALLKQLSDFRVAFFDEPTANMDVERRENLAMQIGQISDFDQLFVISHDDTFEGYLDHEIRIG